MKKILTRTVFLSAAIGSTGLAQDATIYYHTPTIAAGQPVVAAETEVRPVPVYTPVLVDAATAPAPAVPTDADSDYLGAPSVQTSQHDAEVRFVSGGIGMYEKQWFESQQNAFDLKVTYADTTGHHLSGVTVTLADSKHTPVMTVITEGPYLLVKAKPGSYRLTSSYQGQEKVQNISLGKQLTRTSVTFADMGS